MGLEKVNIKSEDLAVFYNMVIPEIYGILLLRIHSRKHNVEISSGNITRVFIIRTYDTLYLIIRQD